LVNKKTGKFSLNEIAQDTEEVVKFDLKKEIDKKPVKNKGGQVQRGSLLKAQLASFSLILRNQKEILRRLERLEK